MADAQVCSNKTHCPSDEWKGSAITSIRQIKCCCHLLTETKLQTPSSKISVSAYKYHALQLLSKTLKIQLANSNNWTPLSHQQMSQAYLYHTPGMYELLPFLPSPFMFLYSCINIISSCFCISTPLYSALSICQQGSTRLPINGFWWNLIFELFSKVCREKFKCH
jgi:hypothetical protein